MLLAHGERVKIMSDSMLYNGLKEFMGCEGKSCSFDPGLITPAYVYRMRGGAVAIEDIEKTLRAFRKS